MSFKLNGLETLSAHMVEQTRLYTYKEHYCLCVKKLKTFSVFAWFSSADWYMFAYNLPPTPIRVTRHHPPNFAMNFVHKDTKSM